MTPLQTLLDASICTVALTGAGVSVASGLPCFRGKGSGPHDREAFQDAKPNEVHQRLADMETRGLLYGVVTQNVDGLHGLAGSRRVAELHGNWRHGITEYGDKLDPVVLRTAENWVRRAKVLLVMGTSLDVNPAATLPLFSFAKIVIINADPTYLDADADMRLWSLDDFMKETQ